MNRILLILIATATIRIFYSVMPCTGIMSGEVWSNESITIGKAVTAK